MYNKSGKNIVFISRIVLKSVHKSKFKPSCMNIIDTSIPNYDKPHIFTILLAVL